MRRNWLIISLVCVLCVVLVARVAVQFGLPAFLRAQTTTIGANEVGPHAAFFDSGNNIKIANMVKSKTSKNLRITVMVDINAPASEITSILGATSGLTPQIRIVGVNHNTYADTSEDKAAKIAGQLNAATIPQGTIVVFGNEINNLDKEWLLCPGTTCPDQAGTAAGEYADFFSRFKAAADSNKYTPVPSPLDMYNGVYTNVEPYINSGAYSGSVVANVYEVGPGLGTWTKYPNNGAGVVAFTEFGPDPAKSLQEHINFFKTHTPEKPATTLIPDKCRSGEEAGEHWLYYVDGKIYDAEGNEVDPATCTAGRRGTPPVGDYYRRFVYPFYSNQSTSASIKQKLEADYSMTCSNPAEYATQISGSIKELIQYQGECRERSGDACLFSPEANFSMTDEGANRLFGVMRNETEAKWRAYDYSQEEDSTKRIFTNRFESVEQWFGANNPAEQQRLLDAQAEERIAYLNRTPDRITGLHQGPFYKLTTLHGQCIAATEILKAANDLCTEWNNIPENRALPPPHNECSLTRKEVAGTTKTMGQLWGEVQGAGGGEAFCSAVYDVHETPPPQNLLELAQDVANVDLYMETAYRPAFLMLVTRVDEENPEVNSGNTQQKFLAQDRGNSSGKDIVDFLVYHVPDTITDIKEGEPGSADDIITRTVRPFFTKEETDRKEEEWTQERAGIAGPLYNPSTDPEQVAIDCRGGVCDEMLRRALIDFVNAYSAAVPGAEKCEVPNRDNKESGTRIGSELAPNDSPESLQNAKNGDPIDEANVAIKVDEYVDVNNQVVNRREKTPQTRIYNIAPYGFRTKYVADAFDALFAKAQQDGQFRQNDKYLTTFEAVFGNELESDPDIVGYQKPSDPAQYDEEGNLIVEQKDVRDEVKLTGNPPFSAPVKWLAKVFNNSTRAVVQQITVGGEALFECARAVNDPKKNTEDFLLNCQSRGSAVGTRPSPGDSTVPNATCTINGGFEIQSTAVGDLLVDASKKYNLPVQVLMAVLYTENCRSGASICNKSDEYLAPYLAPHTPYPETSGCPGQSRVEGTGVFQFNLTYWPSFRDDPNNNACSIYDSFYDAARWLNVNYSSFGVPSTVNQAPPPSQWSIVDMKRALTRWAANTDSCSGHPYANYYCDLIDQMMGNNPSTTEPSILRATPISTTCN